MYIILYNPLSRNRKARWLTKRLVNRFKRNNIPFRLKSLLKIKDVEQYIKDAPHDVKLLLLGGDGTINTFVNQTYNLQLPREVLLMGVGSGNDFLRSMKKQQPKTQPILRMRHDNKSRFFMNGSGLGMDGAIAHRVSQSSRSGTFTYFLAALRTFVTYRPKYMEVEIDGELHKFKKAYLININSGEYIGGGMRLTPGARIEEDELQVVVVHRVHRLMIFLIFLSVYLGLHTKLRRYIFAKKGRHVKATMFAPEVAQCDGECFEKTKTIEVSATSKKAKFRVFDIKSLEKNT